MSPTTDARREATMEEIKANTTDGAREKHISYLEALENVLVKRLYDNRKYDMPKLLPSDHYYDKFWIIVKNAAETKEYYSEKLSEERIRNWVAIFPFGIVPKGIKIIIYGATEIRKDYIKQVEGQKYCQILTTVDEHSEEYDNSVLSLDRLKTVDYDSDGYMKHISNGQNSSHCNVAYSFSFVVLNHLI